MSEVNCFSDEAHDVIFLNGKIRNSVNGTEERESTDCTKEDPESADVDDPVVGVEGMAEIEEELKDEVDSVLFGIHHTHPKSDTSSLSRKASSSSSSSSSPSAPSFSPSSLPHSTSPSHRPLTFLLLLSLHSIRCFRLPRPSLPPHPSFILPPLPQLPPPLTYHFPLPPIPPPPF